MRRLGKKLAALGTWPEPLVRGWRWLPAAAFIGLAPVAASYLFGIPGHPLVTGILLWPVFLACARSGEAAKGLAAVTAAFCVHSALVLLLAELDPAALSRVVAGGADYWREQETWIRTGVDPEYEWRVWVPTHAVLLLAVLVTSSASVGLVTFCYGFTQVDLMNFYCGRLLSQSRSTGVALGLGWHPWSVARGVGYLLIVWAMAEWIMARSSGRETPPRLRWLWTAAFGFVFADAILKWLLLEPVRAGLAANLLS